MSAQAKSPTRLSTLPHSTDAERTVLGALLMDPDAIIKVSDFLKPEDFYDPTYRMIFQGIYDLHQAHEVIDFVTVSNKLTSNKKIQEVGGSSFISEARWNLL